MLHPFLSTRSNLSNTSAVARSRASAASAAASSQSTAKGKGKQAASREQDEEDDQLDELDLVEDSDPEEDNQDELDLPPPLRQRESQASSTNRTQMTTNGSQTGHPPNGTADIAAAMPTPTLGPDDENEAHCMKVR